MQIPGEFSLSTNLDGDWDSEEIESLRNQLSNKPLGFLHKVFSQVDTTTRLQLLQMLKEDNNLLLYSVSPSRWDCPIQPQPLFPQKISTRANSPSPFSSVNKKLVSIVIPSLSVDIEELQKIEGVLFYQERQLYHLLYLRDPRVYIIYITALPLHPSIVNYYLSLIPNAPRVEERLTLFSTFDASPSKTLTQKILERPRLQDKIKRAITKHVPASEANMICFIPTSDEHKLAKALGVRLEASPKEVQFWGSKCGSRQIFRECDLPLPEGCFESIYDEDNLAINIITLWDAKPTLSRVVVKLNEGFSGEGNALLDLRPVASRLYANYKFTPRARSKDVPPFTEKERLIAVKEEFPQLRFQGPVESWESFRSKIKILGCIVEEWIEGHGKQSPSIQGIIHSDGTSEIVSTHEQVLGGADDQVYLGCRFPCDPAYRLQLHQYCQKVAESLASKGARGRFGIDFIAAPSKPWDFDNWNIFALEINLRQGGTTHPFETLRSLTNGTYDNETGVYLSERKEEKFYVASDNVRKESYCGLLPSDLMTIIGNHDLLFDEESQTGVVFHLMGALSQYGKVGMTCIGNSYEEAEELYEKVVKILDNETTLDTDHRNADEDEDDNHDHINFD